MSMRRFRHISLLTLLAILLIGCNPGAPAAPQPAPVAEATTEATAALLPTATPAPNTDSAATTEPAAVAVLPTATPPAAELPTVTPAPDWLQTATVEGDHYILGNPTAPVRLIDYSDFF